MYRYSTEISLYYFIDSFTRIFKELLRELYRPRFAHNASYFILTDFLNNSISILQNQALWFFYRIYTWYMSGRASGSTSRQYRISWCSCAVYVDVEGIVNCPEAIASALSPNGVVKKQSLYNRQPRAQISAAVEITRPP